MPNLKNPMLNLTIIQGRITRDPELKYIASGSAVCHFSIANEYRAKAESGYKSKACFFDATAWGKQAEFVATLRKGADVQVRGALRQEVFDSGGSQRSKVVIQVDRVDAMTWPDDGGSSGRVDGSTPWERGETKPQPEQKQTVLPEDDIPF